MSSGVGGFTGERLHSGGDTLFAIDLARHLAAYRYVAAQSLEGLGLDLGAGSGYGCGELTAAGRRVVGVDRHPPDREHRAAAGCRFVRADLLGLPFVESAFDWAVSFQVIEHMEDPAAYLVCLARVLAPGAPVWITTPNRPMSDGNNPFHVHEYTAEELRTLLARHFSHVEMLGIGASPEILGFHRARLRRVERIVRLDVLGLRHRLPRRFVEWSYGRLALLVRALTRRSEGMPRVDWTDFPVGELTDESLDLLAVCRR